MILFSKGQRLPVLCGRPRIVPRTITFQHMSWHSFQHVSFIYISLIIIVLLWVQALFHLNGSGGRRFVIQLFPCLCWLFLGVIEQGLYSARLSEESPHWFNDFFLLRVWVQVRNHAQSSMSKKEGNIWLDSNWFRTPLPPSDRKLGRNSGDIDLNWNEIIVV